MRPFPAAAIFAASLLTMACERAPKPAKVDVRKAWVRLPATAEVPAAGYFSAEATTDGEELFEVTTLGKVELHQSMSHSGMSTMRPLPTAPFAGRSLAFEPGGKHLMIYGLPAGLKEGGRVALHFRFKAAPPVTVQAELVRPGAGPPEHVH